MVFKGNLSHYAVQKCAYSMHIDGGVYQAFRFINLFLN